MIQKKQSTPPTNLPQPKIHLQFTLKQSLDKHNLTFVDETSYITCNWYNNSSHLKHMGVDGNMISELAYPIYDFKQFIVVSEEEVVILQYNCKDRCSGLVLWNLLKKSYVTISVHSLVDQPEIGIIYFKDSQLVCYYERSIDNKVQLRYYKLSEMSFGKLFHAFTEKKQFCNNSANIQKIQIAKLNQKSMVGFFDKTRYNNQVRFKFYDLDLQKQAGQLKKCSFDIGGILGLQKFGYLNIQLKDVWEVLPWVFYVQVDISVVFGGCKLDTIPKQQYRNIEGYKTFYYNIEEQNLKIGKVNISFPHKLQFINSMRTIKYQQQQKWTIQKRMRQYRRTEESRDFVGMIDAPIYYIEPEGERIFIVNPGASHAYQKELQWLNFNTDLMFQIVPKSQSQEVNQITIYRFSEEWYACQCTLQIVAVHWVSQLVENCCDDLLEIVYNLM